MSGFADEIQAFVEKAKTTERQVFTRVADKVFESVTEGSPLTGAPGQPVAVDGDLKASWTEQVDEREAVISSDHPAAPVIENGTRLGQDLVLHAHVGGFHSVKQTAVNFDRLVDAAVAEVAT